MTLSFLLCKWTQYVGSACLKGAVSHSLSTAPSDVHFSLAQVWQVFQTNKVYCREPQSHQTHE